MHLCWQGLLIAGSILYVPTQDRKLAFAGMPMATCLLYSLGAQGQEFMLEVNKH